MLESLFLLLPVSILFVLLIGVALWWAIFSGQFDNLNEAGRSILEDDDSVEAMNTRPNEAAEDSVETTQQRRADSQLNDEPTPLEGAHEPSKRK